MKSRLLLTNPTRVNTDAVVKAAEQDALKKKDARQSSPNVTGSAAILEFHPAPMEGDSQEDLPVLKQSDSGKGPVKDVHGEIYGESGSGSIKTSRVGGAVGAKTKDGKGYIFIQTEKVKATPSNPQ